MGKWRSKVTDGLHFYRRNEKHVKLAVIIVVMIAALVFFGGKGESEEISVVQAGEHAEQELTVEHDGSAVPAEGTAEPKIVVDIGGCVAKPGVYEIHDGTRLYEVIEMAGGLTKDADTEMINQAEILFDGQKIQIPEIFDETEAGSNAQKAATTGITIDGRININLADSTMLQEIPGVGPATAEKIIDYRENNGKFKRIEDIKNVSGIGEKTFEKIKDMITV